MAEWSNAPDLKSGKPQGFASSNLAPAASRKLPRWIGAGAVVGAISALVLPQGPLPPVYALFWGAVWGALLAATLARLDGARLVAAAVAFGAILPTIAALAVFAPLKGQPTVTGVVPLAVLEAILLNAAWGLATGLGLVFFGQPRGPRRGR